MPRTRVFLHCIAHLYHKNHLERRFNPRHDRYGTQKQQQQRKYAHTHKHANHRSDRHRTCEALRSCRATAHAHGRLHLKLRGPTEPKIATCGHPRSAQPSSHVATTVASSRRAAIHNRRARDLCMLLAHVGGRAACGAGTNDLGACAAALAPARRAPNGHLRRRNTAPKEPRR